MKLGLHQDVIPALKSMLNFNTFLKHKTLKLSIIHCLNIAKISLLVLLLLELNF